MDKILTIFNTEKLSQALNIVHDCKFDKDQIIFNHEALTLEIRFHREIWNKTKIVGKFLFFKKLEIPIMEYRIIIYHVENYQIYEGSQIGPGSEDFINTITYDEQQKQIWISTIIAKGIAVKVRGLKLCIEETGKIIEKKKRTVLSIFFSPRRVENN